MGRLLQALQRLTDPRLNYGREVITELSRACPATCILDIAAGSGEDLRNLRTIHPRAHLIAYDFCQSSVDTLTSQGFEAHCVDLEHGIFPATPGSVDIVVANQILEHTKELFWIFDCMLRALKPGGHLIIGVPNLASLHNRVLLAIGRQPTPIRSASAHVRGFTRSDLVDFVESCFPAGLRLVAYRGSNFYPFPSSLARPLAQLLPSMAWGNFYLFRLVREYDGGFLSFPSAESLETNFRTS